MAAAGIELKIAQSYLDASTHLDHIDACLDFAVKMLITAMIFLNLSKHQVNHAMSLPHLEPTPDVKMAHVVP